MTKFEWEVLAALYRVSRLWTEAYDTTVLQVGKNMYGEGWGGETRIGKNWGMEYAPLLSLALGKLPVAGSSMLGGWLHEGS